MTAEEITLTCPEGPLGTSAFITVNNSDSNDNAISKRFEKISDHSAKVKNPSELIYLIMRKLILPFLARLHEVHRAIAVTLVVPVPVHVTLALKFSRSPYLDNHSSESIHTWTIDEGLAFIPWHRAPGSMPGGGAGG